MRLNSNDSGNAAWEWVIALIAGVIFLILSVAGLFCIMIHLIGNP